MPTTSFRQDAILSKPCCPYYVLSTLALAAGNAYLPFEKK